MHGVSLVITMLAGLAIGYLVGWAIGRGHRRVANRGEHLRIVHGDRDL
jgi:hypothetical protein